MADEKLAELERQRTQTRQAAPTRERPIDALPNPDERTLRRVPPTRERGLGLER